MVSAGVIARRPARYRLGLLLVTASAIAWSTAGLFTRLIPLDSWTMLSWRGVFGALGIFAAILLMERRRALWSFRALGRPGWLFAAVSAVGMIFFITSLTRTTVAHVAIIYATVPFIAAGLAWLVMRERPATGAVLASLAALAGIAVMVGFGADGSLAGDLLALGMTASMAVMMVLSRRFQNIPVMPAACLSALLSAAASWPFGSALSISGQDFALLALFGPVNSAVGLGLFTLGARLLPAIETALIGSLDAPLAPLWVWLAFGEAAGRSTIIGGLVVFAAVFAQLFAAAAARRPASALPCGSGRPPRSTDRPGAPPNS